MEVPFLKRSMKSSAWVILVLSALITSCIIDWGWAKAQSWNLWHQKWCVRPMVLLMHCPRAVRGKKREQLSIADELIIEWNEMKHIFKIKIKNLDLIDPSSLTVHHSMCVHNWNIEKKFLKSCVIAKNLADINSNFLPYRLKESIWSCHVDIHIPLVNTHIKEENHLPGLVPVDTSHGPSFLARYLVWYHTYTSAGKSCFGKTLRRRRRRRKAKTKRERPTDTRSTHTSSQLALLIAAALLPGPAYIYSC